MALIFHAVWQTDDMPFYFLLSHSHANSYKLHVLKHYDFVQCKAIRIRCWRKTAEKQAAEDEEAL